MERRPTYSQHVLSTLLLIGLSMIIAPISFSICVFYALLMSRQEASGFRGMRRPIVMINGSHLSKCLALVRAFGKAGCKVIVVEEGLDGHLTATRFSRYVSAFRTVPRLVEDHAAYISASAQGRASAYIQGLVAIARHQSVDLFVPCSQAESAIADAKAAKLMAQHSGGQTRAIIPSPELTEELHDKGAFMTLLASLGVSCPVSYTVTSVDQAIEVISSHPPSRPLILKATAALDDIGRTDFTLYPIPGDDPACSLARKKLNALPIPISGDEPFILQEFIRGDEYCTHALVISNQLQAFVCCPSSSMLMRYEPANPEISQKAERWTKDFLAAYAAERPEELFTGHFSLDFIYRKEDDTLYPIECNPRAHTAVTLLAENPALAGAYLSALPDRDPEKYWERWSTVYPPPQRPARSWHGHMLVAVVLPYLFPFLTEVHIHPSYNYGITDEYIKSQVPYKDATWDPEDPWPFFVLYHVQWPWALLKFLFTRRQKRWSRLNVSTGTMFEC